MEFSPFSLYEPFIFIHLAIILQEVFFFVKSF